MANNRNRKLIILSSIAATAVAEGASSACCMVFNTHQRCDGECCEWYPCCFSLAGLRVSVGTDRVSRRNSLSFSGTTAGVWLELGSAAWNPRHAVVESSSGPGEEAPPCSVTVLKIVCSSSHRIRSRDSLIRLLMPTFHCIERNNALTPVSALRACTSSTFSRVYIVMTR